MTFEPGIEIGQILSKEEIHQIFKVDTQQGIRPSKKNNCIVIVLTKNKKYEDKWNKDGYRINYTGVGQVGDQQLIGRNKTLLDTLYNKKDIYFFEQESVNKYIYRGLCYLEKEPKQSKQIDKNGNLRIVYMFPLKLYTKRKDFYHSLKEEVIFEQEERDYNFNYSNINERDLKLEMSLSDFSVRKKKRKPSFQYGVKIYPREKSIGLNALKRANFQCEYDNSHRSFIRKNMNILYTEPHHLVPISFSDQFEYSLDVEENIVSLCSNCHNEIHYGRDRYILLKKLFDDRKDRLKQVGIEITFEELKQMYK